MGAMAADDAAAEQVVEPELKRQRLSGEGVEAYPNGGLSPRENAEQASPGAIAPIEAPPSMEFNAEEAGDEEYAEDGNYGVAEVDSSAWAEAPAEGTEDGYDNQFSDAEEDGAENEDEEEDVGEEDDDEEEDDEEEDDEEEDENGEDDEDDEAQDEDSDGGGDGEGGEEVKPDSLGWYDLTPAQRQAAQELQYSREAWDNCTRTEVTDLEYWHQLTEEQQKAAQVRRRARAQFSRTHTRATSRRMRSCIAAGRMRSCPFRCNR